MKFFIILNLILSNGLTWANSSDKGCKEPGLGDILSSDNTAMLEGLSEELSNPSQAPYKLNIKLSSSNRKWPESYTDSLYQTFSGSDFYSFFEKPINQADLETLKCPTLNSLTKDEKKKFYIVYMAALAEAGSDYNSDTVSYSKADKTTNYGLLQIDPKSAVAHAKSVIGRSIDGERLKEPDTNLKIGAYILKNQISGKIATGRLLPDKVYYWPTLKYAQKRILNTIEKNLDNLPFCKTDGTQAVATVPENTDESNSAPIPKALKVESEADTSLQQQIAPTSLTTTPALRKEAQKSTVSSEENSNPLSFSAYQALQKKKKTESKVQSGTISIPKFEIFGTKADTSTQKNIVPSENPITEASPEEKRELKKQEAPTAEAKVMSTKESAETIDVDIPLEEISTSPSTQASLESERKKSLEKLRTLLVKPESQPIAPKNSPTAPVNEPKSPLPKEESQTTVITKPVNQNTLTPKKKEPNLYDQLKIVPPEKPQPKKQPPRDVHDAIREFSFESQYEN